MRSKKHYKSTRARAMRIKAIVDKYYEVGNHRRSLRVVYEHYVSTIYPMSFRTMLNYMRIAREMERSSGEVASPDTLAYSLFDVWDSQRDRLGRVKPCAR